MEWTEHKVRTFLPTVQIESDGTVYKGKLTSHFGRLATVRFDLDYNGRRIPIACNLSWDDVCNSLNNHTPLSV